jgi:fatty acyl-CoA reductase
MYLKKTLVKVFSQLFSDFEGIATNEIANLQSKINYVIHCAASVDFREKLDDAIRKNTLGTMKIFSFAKTCTSLQGFIHVSTAYVNCDRDGFHQEVKLTLT